MKKIFMDIDIIQLFKPLAITILVIGFFLGIFLAFSIPIVSYENISSIMSGTRTIENESFNYYLLIIVWVSCILFDIILYIAYELLKGLYQLNQTASEILSNIKIDESSENPNKISSKDIINNFINNK